MQRVHASRPEQSVWTFEEVLCADDYLRSLTATYYSVQPQTHSLVTLNLLKSCQGYLFFQKHKKTTMGAKNTRIFNSVYVNCLLFVSSFDRARKSRPIFLCLHLTKWLHINLMTRQTAIQ